MFKLCVCLTIFVSLTSHADGSNQRNSKTIQPFQGLGNSYAELTNQYFALSAEPSIQSAKQKIMARTGPGGELKYLCKAALVGMKPETYFLSVRFPIFSISSDSGKYNSQMVFTGPAGSTLVEPPALYGSVWLEQQLGPSKMTATPLSGDFRLSNDAGVLGIDLIRVLGYPRSGAHHGASWNPILMCELDSNLTHERLGSPNDQ